MITRNEEFGAPWNDQFYNVTFYFKLNLDGVEFISEQLETQFTLSGPHNYDYSELKEHAYNTIDNVYKFDYNQIVILNINQT